MITRGLSSPLLMTSLNAALVPTAAALWSMPTAVSSAGAAAIPSAVDINAIIKNPPAFLHLPGGF